MNKVKAIIKLADGNVGFYDNLTQIHLTILSPLGRVYEGMNTTNLQRGVVCNTIEVLEGSLTSDIVEEEPMVSVPMEELTPAEKVEEKVPEVVEPEKKEEDTTEEVTEEKAEEKAEESEEEVKETKTRKRRTSKKTTSSTEESK